MIPRGKSTALAATALGLCVTAAMAQEAQPTFAWGERNTDLAPAFDAQFRAELVESGVTLQTETLAEGLSHPWGIAALPDGGFLVTERSGDLRHLAMDGTLSDPIEGVPDVLAQKQGGLLDVALSPDFADDRTIFLTYAKPMEGGTSATSAARAVLSEDMISLTEVQDIFVQDPPSTAPMHFGSRIVLPGDGTALITTGEHSADQYRVFAQDLDKTYGKVIRINTDGSVPEDNPFTSDPGAVDTIWSYGHRNIQGATLDDDGTLWTIEHGPKGGDELNRPEAGKNYGWPVISYGKRYSGGPIGSGAAAQDGMEQPVYFWDPVIAPAGMVFHDGDSFADWNGDLLISSLTPGGVVRLELDEDGQVIAEERLMRDVGRVRDIELLEDGSFVILTDFDNGSVIHVTPG
jgi:aldose sugar dehydrogenase